MLGRTHDFQATLPSTMSASYPGSVIPPQPGSTSTVSPGEPQRKGSCSMMLASMAMTVWSSNWVDDAVTRPILEYVPANEAQARPSINKPPVIRRAIDEYTEPEQAEPPPRSPVIYLSIGDLDVIMFEHTKRELKRIPVNHIADEFGNIILPA
ncbi:unnamed protein product [Echinostoma caproni]|uniref:Uncharacterized protein n=1 Tax=Echinostoma caproni TaxID=27848 RepID=A0A183AM11_9TREM|nr:unnamed protein product [Echinostoma caproni]